MKRSSFALAAIFSFFTGSLLAAPETRWVAKKDAPPIVIALLEQQRSLLPPEVAKAKAEVKAIQAELTKANLSIKESVRAQVPEIKERLAIATKRRDDLVSGKTLAYPAFGLNTSAEEFFKTPRIGLFSSELSLMQQIDQHTATCSASYLIGGSTGWPPTPTFTERQTSVLVVGFDNSSFGSKFTLKEPVIASNEQIDNGRGVKTLMPTLRRFKIEDFATINN